MFTGSLVAIVTPFRQGKVDERALAELIEWQIANGTNGVVPCGTTGESATLSHSEHNRVIELTVEVVRRSGVMVVGLRGGRHDCSFAYSGIALPDSNVLFQLTL